MRYQSHKIKDKTIAIFLLAIIIFIISLFEDHSAWVEQYYSKGLYMFICRVMHPVFNLFPFSIGDLLYVLVMLCLIYFVLRLIVLVFKKQFINAGNLILGLVIAVQIAMVIFYLFWGINYYRPPAAERLNLRDTSYTTADLQAVTCIIIDSANACRARVTPADLQQDNSTIYQTAIAAVKKLSADSANFRAYSPRVKSSLLTLFMNYIGTSGYYNPFTTEAQVNYQMPVFDRPVVACHEMSHQMGYGAEDEANFAGFLAGIGSRDRLLRYSAYHLALDECMRALRHRDTLANNELKTHLSKSVRNDFKAERAYWLSFRGKAGILSSIFYDDFLKANNQPQGLNTYNQMVLLLMAWYGK
jgi:hypothetical protein